MSAAADTVAAAARDDALPARLEIGDWLDLGSVALRSGAPGKRQALGSVADIAARRLGVDAGQALEALCEREAESSTGVGYGVGLPHAIAPGLTRLRAVFVRLETPVAFDAIDGQPVDLLFALFAPPDAGTAHLRGLARVARLLRRRDIRERLRGADTPDALHAILVDSLARAERAA